MGGAGAYRRAVEDNRHNTFKPTLLRLVKSVTETRNCDYTVYAQA